MTMHAEGALAPAGLVVHKADRDAEQQAGVHGAAHALRCLNCDAVLAGGFCHVCGQRAHVHKSLLHLGEEVLHGVLHFDAKGLRTLPMLVLHPGLLTRRYIDGHRTRFVSPLALFLFMVFLLFFVASLTSGNAPGQLATSPAALAEARQNLNEERVAAQQSVAAGEAVLAQARAGKGDVARAQIALGKKQAHLLELDQALSVLNTTGAFGRGARIDLSDFKMETAWPAADAALRHAADNPALTIYKLKSTGAKLSFLLVPISLPFLWLLFCWKRGVTMYDHAVFSLYSLSFMALLFVVLFLLNFAGASFLLPWLVCLLPPLHMYVQLRGTYGLRGAQALWRTGALLCIAATVFVLYLMLILIMSMG